MQVLKNESATDKYGEKGKNGVIIITTKLHADMNNQKDTDSEKKDQFVVVEELPQFPGGAVAMTSWINSNLKYPEEAMKKNIKERFMLRFL